MEECYFWLKVAVFHGCFLCFLNYTNWTKSHNASQLFWKSWQNISVKLRILHNILSNFPSFSRLWNFPNSYIPEYIINYFFNCKFDSYFHCMPGPWMMCDNGIPLSWILILGYLRAGLTKVFLSCFKVWFSFEINEEEDMKIGELSYFPSRIGSRVVHNKISQSLKK